MRRVRVLSVLMLAAGWLAAATATSEPPVVATFSIVAFDPKTGDMGVAVESKFFSVGPVVPWVESGVGAIATQAAANTTYGPRGLELLRMGLSPEQVGKLLTEADEGRDRRQLGIVDVKGNAYTYTGPRCQAWAGGRQGKDAEGRPYAVQGNILTGEEVVAAMEQAFLSAPGELADKLAAALAAGQAAGGDSRGQQSAALVVKRPRGGYAGLDDHYIDLRVEDHPEPIKELARVLGIRNAMSLMGAAGRAMREQKPEEAWATMQRAIAAAPEYPDVLYAAAAFQARAGKTAEALDWLGKAIARNPRLKRSAQRDPAFASLRENPAFQTLIRD
jgi:uncharacterized Ntn-hydrolase superfamily protein